MKCDKKGDLGTFVIRVKCYENATWQGEVMWADKDRTQKFRSALELLKLIDSALELTEEGKTEQDQGNENTVL